MFYSPLSLNSLKLKKVASLFELRVGVAQLQLDKTLGSIKSPSAPEVLRKLALGAPSASSACTPKTYARWEFPFVT